MNQNQGTSLPGGTRYKEIGTRSIPAGHLDERCATGGPRSLAVMVDSTPRPKTKREAGPAASAAHRAYRRSRFLPLFDPTDGRGLEIGPLDSAVCDKRTDDVRYVDVFDQAGLRRSYAGDQNVVLDDIPDVDFWLIDDERSLSLAEAAAPGAPYDWVFASHVIEHVPDLIGWLDQIAQLTHDDSRLILAVPDRRYCFDRHRPPTTIGQMLDAHEAGATTPSIRAVYDYLSSAVTVDAPRLWTGARPPGREALIHGSRRAS